MPMRRPQCPRHNSLSQAHAQREACTSGYAARHALQRLGVWCQRVCRSPCAATPECLVPEACSSTARTGWAQHAGGAIFNLALPCCSKALPVCESCWGDRPAGTPPSGRWCRRGRPPPHIAAACAPAAGPHPARRTPSSDAPVTLACATSHLCYGGLHTAVQLAIHCSRQCTVQYLGSHAPRNVPSALLETLKP